MKKLIIILLAVGILNANENNNSINFEQLGIAVEATYIELSDFKEKSDSKLKKIDTQLTTTNENTEQLQKTITELQNELITIKESHKKDTRVFTSPILKKLVNKYSKPKHIEVITKKAVLRNAAKIDSDVVGEAVQGEILLYNQFDGNFYHLQNNKYIHKSVVKAFL